MPNENEQQPSTTVSKESFDRVVHERDQLKAQNEQLSTTLTSYSKRDHAREFFKSHNVADPDAAADLATPHLADVENDKIAEFLSSQSQFKPLLVSAAAPVGDGGGAGNGDNAGGGTAPAVETPSSFGGPSPGGAAGGIAPQPTTKVSTTSDEYKRAVAENNTAQIEKWAKEGVLESPTRPW